MRLYLDTEYHGARRAQRLLSVGVVAEDGRWFYGELPAELARVVDHDDFFATHVTPQFGRVPGAAFLDPASLAAALRDFLAGLVRPGAAAPPGAALSPVPADRAGLIAQGPLARRFGLRAHHALADAESLRLAAQRRGPPTVVSMA